MNAYLNQTLVLRAKDSLKVNEKAAMKVAEGDRVDIAAALGGDHRAFERLVRRYDKVIAGHLWRFTRDGSELEELVQDTFVEAYKSLKSFKGNAPFSAWLRTIATRAGYRLWKSKRRSSRHIGEAELDIDTLASAQESTPSEAAEYVHRVLERLNPEDRVVLTLLYFEDLDTREIAKELGWSRSLVKVRAHRARKKLKKYLEQAGFGREVHE